MCRKRVLSAYLNRKIIQDQQNPESRRRVSTVHSKRSHLSHNYLSVVAEKVSLLERNSICVKNKNTNKRKHPALLHNSFKEGVGHLGGIGAKCWDKDREGELVVEGINLVRARVWKKGKENAIKNV